jgi:hypothetical protein
VRETTGIHMRARGDITNGAATHDPEPRLSRHLLYAAAIVARPSNARGARLLPEPDQISSHVSLGQQRPSAQTGMHPKKFVADRQTLSNDVKGK